MKLHYRIVNSFPIHHLHPPSYLYYEKVKELKKWKYKKMGRFFVDTQFIIAWDLASKKGLLILLVGLYWLDSFSITVSSLLWFDNNLAASLEREVLP